MIGLFFCSPLLTSHQVGFKSFLNITPTIVHGVAPHPSSPGGPENNSTAAQANIGSSFTLTVDENPLAEFVELPEEALEGGLWFSNILCGVIRGALEMVCLLLIRMYLSLSNASGLIGSDASTGRIRI